MNYKDYMHADIDDKFNYFMSTLTLTNHTPSYWVNWQNVIKNTPEEMKIALHTMDYLIGTKDIKQKAEILFTQQIYLVKLIPILLASRNKIIDVLHINNDNGKFYTETIDFSHPQKEKIPLYISFMDETGLLDFLQNYLKKSLVDYVFGVDTGLDSNGRKNRSGTQNEDILEMNLRHLVANTSLVYKTQATAKYIWENWHIRVPEDKHKTSKGGRRYDGAVYNPKTNVVTVIETNFFSGGGSKLKAVAGEFSNLYQILLTSQQVKFVWISDGHGWESAKNPLHEAFGIIPNIFNLYMVQQGFLKNIVQE